MTTTTNPNTDERTTYCVQAIRTEFSWVYLKARTEEEAWEIAEGLADEYWKYADYSEERTIDYVEQQEPASWEEVLTPPANENPASNSDTTSSPLADIIARHVSRSREKL